MTVWTNDEVGGDVWSDDEDAGESLRDQLAASDGSSMIGFVQSGTGATSSTVQAELRRWFWAEQFGATGDGTTNDAAAIQAAIDVLETNRGGTLLFQAKKYNLSTTGVTIAAGEHGVRLVGMGEGFTNDEGPAGTEFAYTGTGVAVDIGGSGTRTDGVGLEHLTINITGAGAAANCLKVTRSQQFMAIGCNWLTSQGAASATGQTAVVLDGGADFSAYGVFLNCKVRGDFTKGYVSQNGGQNSFQWIGGSILQTCSGTPASTIGFDHAVGNGCMIFGTDFDGWATALKIADDRNTVIARFESGGNTVDVEFAATADKNILQGGMFDPTKVTNAGASNSIQSPDQFVFTAGGKLGIGTGSPDSHLDARHASLAEIQVKATNADGIARVLFANGDRAYEWRCHSNDTALLRDATAGVTKMSVNATGIGFYTASPVALQTGVAVDAAGIHAALVNLGLITA